MADNKAPKNATLMDFFNAAQERPEQFQQGLETLNAVNDKFGAAQRGAVSAAQTATSPMQVLEGAKAAFMTPEQAATWQDIAKRAGVENKYGLAAAGLIGPMAEMDLIPGPNFGAAKKEVKALSNLADDLQVLNKEGKIMAGAAKNSAGQGLRQAAKAEQELRAAQNLASEAPVQNVVKFKDAQAKEAAKAFAKDTVRAELQAQPALARDPNYLKQRIQELFNVHLKQNSGK